MAPKNNQLFSKLYFREHCSFERRDQREAERAYLGATEYWRLLPRQSVHWNVQYLSQSECNAMTNANQN